MRTVAVVGTVECIHFKTFYHCLEVCTVLVSPNYSHTQSTVQDVRIPVACMLSICMLCKIEPSAVGYLYHL